MTGPDAVLAASQQVAEAIAARDLAALERLLAPGFVHRAHGGAASAADAFMAAVAGIPGAIQFVRLEQLAVDPTPAGALVSGIQHARIVVDGTTIDDRRRFVDLFVRDGDAWRLQAAIDVPEQAP